jgi:hypothetical protein
MPQTVGLENSVSLTSNRRSAVSSGAASGSSGELAKQPPSVWARGISFEALGERLTLLFQLELPCILHFMAPQSSWAHRKRINRCERCDRRLVLMGDRFSVHLSEDQIEAFCVTIHFSGGRTRKVIELRNKRGHRCARILGLCSDRQTEVWHDILDTFILPMLDAEQETLSQPLPQSESRQARLSTA